MRFTNNRMSSDFHGFTLVETVVALTVISVVILSAAVVMHRILSYDVLLKEKAGLEMTAARVLAESDFAFVATKKYPESRTSFSPDGFLRINYTFYPESPSSLSKSSVSVRSVSSSDSADDYSVAVIHMPVKEKNNEPK